MIKTKPSLFALFLATAWMQAEASSAKQSAVAIVKALETGDSTAFAHINPDKYIQHNLDAADGLAGFKAFQTAVAGSATINTLRVFQDGNYVFAHTNYSFGGVPMAGIDVWRLENGLFVEHWDSLQVNDHGPNPAGRGMLDGPTQVKDLDKTTYNKAIVSKYADSLVNGPWDNSVLAENLIQHNPIVGDGIKGFVDGLDALVRSGVPLVYAKVFKVLAEGDFVLVMSLGSIGPTPVSIYDLFRLEGGKIVENWDAIQEIPSPYKWRNMNGKF